MKNGSWHITTIADIPIKIHWSFGLLLLFVMYQARQESMAASDMIWWFILVCILFIFVIMHEYGHALTARKFGVRTKDIIISPIGGVARLTHLPKIAKQELLIAIAGPAVNVALLIFLLALQIVLQNDIFAAPTRINAIHDFSGYINILLQINFFLILFNMIPAFPMDGGRVLRALLAMFTGDRLKATYWASWVGRILAVLFMGLGFYYQHYILMFIGFFVYTSARAEYRQLKVEHRLNNIKAGDMMRRDFTRLHADQGLSTIRNYQEENSFLVFDDNQRIVGALPKSHIDEHLKKLDITTTIGDVQTKQYGIIDHQMTLHTLFNMMNQNGWAIVGVVDAATRQLLGVIDRDMVRQKL